MPSEPHEPWCTCTNERFHSIQCVRGESPTPASGDAALRAYDEANLLVTEIEAKLLDNGWGKTTRREWLRTVGATDAE